MNTDEIRQHKIILFDGVCNLCNRSDAWEERQVAIHRRRYAMAQPEPIAAKGAKRRRPGAGWTVAGVLDLLRKEARHRKGEVAAAFTELAELIEKDVRE